MRVSGKIAAALTLASLLSLTPRALPAEAVSLSFAEAREKVIAYAVQIGLLTADLIPVNEIKKYGEAIDDVNKSMAAEKHANYATDHYRLAEANRIEADAAGYINRLVGGGAGAYDAVFPLYASLPARARHADVYKARAREWRARMKKITEDNNYAVNDIISAQGDVNKALFVVKGAYGYTRHLDAGAQITNYMNAELSKLAADMDRRLAVTAEAAANDQRERAEEFAAFEAAVGTWNADGGASY